MRFNNVSVSLLIALGLFCAAPAASQAVPTTYPTGVTFYNPEKAYNGYTILAGSACLIDMNGNLVKRWNSKDGMPNKILPGGRLMTSGETWKDGQQDKTSLVTLDFNGKQLWEFRDWQNVPAIPGQPQKDGKTPIARQHHDFQRKDTPVYFTPSAGSASSDAAETTLVLSHTNEKIARIHPSMQLVTDVLLEVDSKGKVVWTWKISDHVDELGFTDASFKAMNTFPPSDNRAAGRHGTKIKPGAGYDWMHINCASYVGPNKWFDAGDRRFNPDNIIVNSRDSNMMFIIERATGKVVWRLGPNFAPGTEDFKVGQIVGAHGIHIIPRGLPGEGNILFFDNGGLGGYGAPTPDRPVSGFHNVQRPYSRVVEFNPVTKEIVWEYDWHKNHKGLLGHMDFKFFSPFVSYAQRLPNGNTVITEGDMSRIFEITSDYETVWEYLSPYADENAGILYRSYRVPYDWVPQATHAEEVAVIPPANSLFSLPNAKGEYPNTGVQGDMVKASLTAAQTHAEESNDEEFEDEAATSMHNY
ncbi:aryl-sulfate sulfotransferase [uncultured Mailhella sp.]|uniref:aryl-sulfate sulfotransferase n=1 Tax=uncultured Mailhella sp. TaxID=1981031 RepID=UPI0032081D34